MSILGGRLYIQKTYEILGTFIFEWLDLHLFGEKCSRNKRFLLLTFFHIFLIE